MSETQNEIKTGRLEMFGIPVTDVTQEALLALLMKEASQRRQTHVVNINPHRVLAALDDASYMSILRSSEVSIVDGFGIRVAAFLLGMRVPRRLAGVDLMLNVCERAAEQGLSIFLVGGRNESVFRCADRLRVLYPMLRIVGALEPPYASSARELIDDRTLSTIRDSDPDFLFVALGVKKEEEWIEQVRSHINAGVLMGVGASFDLIGGRIPRAPLWMRRAGLEWTFRLLLEPRRLAGRYLIGIPRFLLTVALYRLFRS